MTTIDASKTALFAIHLQRDILVEGTAFGSIFAPEFQSRGVIGRINAATRSMRSRNGLVIVTRAAYAPDFADLVGNLPLLAMVEEVGCLVEGTAGAEFVPEFDLQPSDLVVTHKRVASFVGTDLDQTLRERGIENVVVCGVATNGSVEQTVRQAADLGYRAFVLSDASSAAETAIHDASIASMGLFATALTVDEFSSQLV